MIGLTDHSDNDKVRDEIRGMTAARVAALRRSLPPLDD